MILLGKDMTQSLLHSPRIRGDDPLFAECVAGFRRILPVFAGMIRNGGVEMSKRMYSPRIRGDDPHA